MSDSNHRELIERARVEHANLEQTDCFLDGEYWPCLTARLADALDQVTEQRWQAMDDLAARHHELAQQLHDERMAADRICLEWADKLDAVEARVHQAVAEHRSCGSFLEDAQIQLSLAQEDLQRSQADLVRSCEAITTYVEATAVATARAERLAGYAQHREYCPAKPVVPIFGGDPFPTGADCSCGLSAALGRAVGEENHEHV